jgi:hypothetical protein
MPLKYLKFGSFWGFVPWAPSRTNLNLLGASDFIAALDIISDP